MTTTTGLRIDNRPKWGDLPIPYITRLAGEIVLDPVRFDGDGLFYDDETIIDRDQYDILWTRELILKSGRPEWAQVHSHRQRRCMRKKLCQVCAHPLDKGPYNFVLSNDEYGASFFDGTTSTPPVCDECAEVAPSLCPHLSRAGFTTLRVRSFKDVGVYGSIAWYNAAEQGLVQERGRVRFDQGKTWTRRVLAKGSIVELAF